MDCKVENLNENILDNRFFFTFNNTFNKNERGLLNFLFHEFLNKSSSVIKMERDFFENTIKIETKSIYSFLEKLSKKSVSYEMEVDSERISGTFNIISSFFIKNNSIFVFLPQELDTDLGFSIPNLIDIYSFKDKNSFIFYSHFFNEFSTRSNFEVDFDELKKILGLENKYERFFDFEKNVIRHLLDDFSTTFSLKCEKLKKGNSINNRVIGFKFTFDNGNENLKLKSLLFLLKNDITDLKEVEKTLKSSIEKFGYDLISKKCFSAKQNWKNMGLSFDEYLKKLCSEI